MRHIDQKTLSDLEFDTVLNHIEDYCHCSLGKKSIQKIKPIHNNSLLFKELKRTEEFAYSFENNNIIPSYEFKDLQREIELLNIENSYLDSASFLKISHNTKNTNTLIQFFKKLKEIYPYLFNISSKLEINYDLIKIIQKTINKFGKIEDNASPRLKSIRKEINALNLRLKDSFAKSLRYYFDKGYLDEIRETVIENQSVLAVESKYRKKVDGLILGTSKTGSILYVVPRTTQQLYQDIQCLHDKEHSEIIHILKELTNEIQPYRYFIKKSLKYLIYINKVAAKAKYARDTKSVLPKISKTKKVFLKEAYHPVLYLNNIETGVKTIPQTLELSTSQKIIVISGPNAGGKSVTLKTVGLLQIMLQSGILIPVDKRSELFFFDTILTDIGDNQSIENQLSTYSYRLKNMCKFLSKCNENTLFLIDEFGSGSDPELGGALAEVFLEEFYHKNAFGIITTHYTNLKVLANELENVSNANMEFDYNTLEPKYILLIGQAGSSYTFEVAQKNGIPFELINQAKKRVKKEKIRLDQTISNLQIERTKLKEISENLELARNKTQEQEKKLEDKKYSIQGKLDSFSELYNHNKRLLNMGRKLNELFNKYFQTKNKKQLIIEFNKWTAIELNKHISKVCSVDRENLNRLNIERKSKLENLKNVEKDVLERLKKTKENRIKQKVNNSEKKISYTFKINDKVRLTNSKAIGTINKIEKTNVLIDYGTFIAKAKLEQIELVSSSEQ